MRWRWPLLLVVAFLAGAVAANQILNNGVRHWLPWTPIAVGAALLGVAVTDRLMRLQLREHLGRPRRILLDERGRRVAHRADQHLAQLRLASAVVTADVRPPDRRSIAPWWTAAPVGVPAEDLVQQAGHQRKDGCPGRVAADEQGGTVSNGRVVASPHR